MRDGRWHTIQEIHEAVGGSETGISARVRDLRKERNGGFMVERERVGKTGLWKYRAAIHPDWDDRQRRIIRKAVARHGTKHVAKKLGVSRFALKTFLEE